MTAVPDPAHVPADGSAIGARAGKAWGPVRGDPGRAARLFADAERAAQSITDEYWKAGTLCDLAATDPDRAARLIADAERTARSFTDEDAKASALAAVAKALAATDPDRAERIAQSITDEYLKASALTNLARAAVQHAADDPEAAEPERGR